MSVKRYDMGDTCGGEYRCGMKESEDGEYVLFEDFKAAEDKLAKIRKKASAENVENWDKIFSDEILAILNEKENQAGGNELTL